MFTSSSTSRASLAISILALLVASGGATYAAVIAPGSVTTAALRNGAVTTSKIANGAVTSAKITDGRVSRNDLRPGLLPFGTDTHRAVRGAGAQCTLGTMSLTASTVGVGMPANGQILQIASNTALFSLLGTTYGGDGVTTFALPNLRNAAPDHMTWTICTAGVFPSRLD